MKRTFVAATSVAAMIMLPSGCAVLNAAHDISKAAKGIANASKDAQDFQAKVDKSKTLTFTATYVVKKQGSPDETIVMAQKPPKSMYKQGDSLLVDDGNRISSCGKSNGHDECTDLAPHFDGGFYGTGVGGLGGFTFAFNPLAFTGLYLAAAIVPGVEVSKSHKDVAGLKSDCNTITITEGKDKGNKLIGCTTADGVFTYSFSTGDSEVMLTKFESSVSSHAFDLPAKPQSIDDQLNNSSSSTSSTTSRYGRSTTSTTFGDTSTTRADTSTSSLDTTSTTSGP